MVEKKKIIFMFVADIDIEASVEEGIDMPAMVGEDMSIVAGSLLVWGALRAAGVWKVGKNRC